MQLPAHPESDDGGGRERPPAPHANALAVAVMAVGVVLVAALVILHLTGVVGPGTGPGEQGRDRGAVAEGARRIEVTAESLTFRPDEITVTTGEDVAIVLRSEDDRHDFVVDELDVAVAAGRGETATGGLRAEEPGEHTFYCSVPGHREAGMEGVLVVEEGRAER